ncbi:type II secretion system F family protein [Blautia sp.]|uniref:type II secretion system F family protein n=1 Tax=Blautia sp. TaxID=1955243 RepID=UPI00258AB146|nr:type II secretion system F family protein [Blautia sp.]
MKALSNNELSTFCSQMALILRSGISSTEGLSIMLEDAPQEEGQQILRTVLEHIEQTGCLWSSLEEAQFFPKYLCNMVEIGEQAGRLDDVMASLAEHYEREDAISKNIKSAVTYPLVMIVMMLAVVLVLITKVMPIFEQVFEQLGTGLTGISKSIMGFGQVLNRYALVFIVIAAVVIALFFYFSCTSRGRESLRNFAGRFFLTKGLSEKLAAARFASGMSLALSSGLDTDQSLEMVSRLTDHPAMQEKIQTARNLISEGAGFSDALSKAGIFSGLYARMVHIGFHTGAMDDVMRQIAAQYGEEVNEQITGLVSKLEPTLVAVLSVVVGMILLSVMLPLMGIMSSIG